MTTDEHSRRIPLIDIIHCATTLKLYLTPPNKNSASSQLYRLHVSPSPLLLPSNSQPVTPLHSLPQCRPT